MIKEKLEDYVTTIPDFPQPGIMFRDITTIIEDPDGFKMSIDQLSELIKDVDYDVMVAVESRGFVFASPIAYNSHKPVVLVRKKGKLPRETIEQSYDLEYGTATVEMHKDSIKPGQKVILCDDLIATGGTLWAAAKLVETLGGEVAGIISVMELKGLNGRDKLPYPVYTLIQYEGK